MDSISGVGEIIRTWSSNALNCCSVETPSSLQDVTDSSELRATMLSHLCGSAALITFVIEGRLNQALCST